MTRLGTETLGWGNELVGWGDELIGWGDELIGCPSVTLSGNLSPEIVGTDEEWMSLRFAEDDQVGFFGMIAAAIGGIAAAASGAAAGAAAAVGPVVAAVGGVAAVGKLVEGGVKEAEKLVKAAEGGDEKALAKLKGVQREQAAKLAKKGEKKLAEVMVRARAGDLKAQAVLAGIKLLKDPPLDKIGKLGVFMQKFKALPQKRILQDAVNNSINLQAAQNWKAFEKRAYEAAKKSGKLPKQPPKVKLPIDAMVKSARAGAVKKLKAGAVKLKKQQAKGKRGARGILVTPGGKLTRGNWLPDGAAK